MVPFDWAGQRDGQRLHVGAAEAGIEDEGLNIMAETHGAVHLRLDVVAESVLVVGPCAVDHEHSRGDAELDGFEHAVRIAESSTPQGLPAEPYMGRSEPGRCTGGLSAEVERAVFWSFRREGVVICAAEDAALQTRAGLRRNLPLAGRRHRRSPPFA